MKATRLRAGNLETATLTYKRGRRTATLIGVTHVADAEFWDVTNYRIDSLGCEVHHEGVSGPKRASKLGTYADLADFLGLLDQHRGLNYEKYWKRTDLTWDQIVTALGAKKTAWMERNAAKGWEAIMEAKEAGFSRRIGLRATTLLLGLMPVLPSRVLLNMRNDVAVQNIEAATADVCAVWGANHLPGIGKKLKESGWTLTSEDWVVAITGNPMSKHAAPKRRIGAVA